MVSVPLGAVRDLPVEPLAGKIVMDTVNCYPQRDGRVAELDDVAAKEAVVSFLDDIGYDAVDAGPLGEAVRYRDMTD